MTTHQATAIADEIISMFETHGGAEYAGEPVTQLEHMVQAAELAREEGHGNEVILAAFLHDIGHICVSANAANAMGAFGIKDHEEVGAAYLRDKGFSPALIKLVESHVDAKRYLTYKDPEYYSRLSDASKTTLEYQGGPMLQPEADAFESDPLFHSIIDMRLWDEAAKRTGQEMPSLNYFRHLIIAHLIERPETSSHQNALS